MAFDDLKDRMEDGDADARRRAIEDFVGHYVSGSNPTLRRIANREIFQQLRPLHSADDVVSLAMQKVADRLATGKLRLRTEKQFLAYVTNTMRLIILDLNRRQRLAVADLNASGVDVAASDPGASTALMAKEAKELLQHVLTQFLTADEFYLVRRYYFEEAPYEVIANEVLRPSADPITAQERENRSATVRMRLDRIREKLKTHDETLLQFLSK